MYVAVRLSFGLSLNPRSRDALRLSNIRWKFKKGTGEVLIGASGEFFCSAEPIKNVDNGSRGNSDIETSARLCHANFHLRANSHGRPG